MRIEEAELIARLAHTGQVDRNGEPYILHPEAVAKRLRFLDHPDWVVAVGWLHDVIEDTVVTMENLGALGLKIEQTNVLDALTRREGEVYAEYIDRVIGAGHTARTVKIVDINHNLHPLRRFDGDGSLRERYKKALGRLYERHG